MIDTSLIGLTGPKYEMDVERGKIREFVRAVYGNHPAYIDDPHPVMPPTFLTMAGYIWGYTLERPRGTVFESINYNTSTTLLAEESYRYHGTPPRAGTTLVAQTKVEDITVKQGSRGGKLTFFSMLTEFWDQSGALVAEGRCLTVDTERRPEDDAWATDIPDYQPHYEGYDPPMPFADIEEKGWDDLEPGSGPGTFVMDPLTVRDIMRYQAASASETPLHYDLTFARSQGFPSLYFAALQQGSALASYAVNWLGPLNVRFTAARINDMVWVGESLTYCGTIARKYEQDGKRLVDVDLRCCRASIPDKAVVKVSMTFDLS